MGFGLFCRDIVIRKRSVKWGEGPDQVPALFLYAVTVNLRIFGGRMSSARPFGKVSKLPGCFRLARALNQALGIGF